MSNPTRPLRLTEPPPLQRGEDPTGAHLALPSVDVARQYGAAGLLALAAMATLSSLALVAAAAGWFGAEEANRWPLAVSAVVTAALGVALAVLGRLHGQGSDHAAPIASVLLSAAVPLAAPSSAFAGGLPEVVWLGPLVAVAMASWRAVGISLAVTTLGTVAFHGAAILASIGSVIGAIAVFTVAATGRLLREQRVEAEREKRLLAHRVALFDDLTGLPNRRLLGDRLESAILESRRQGQPIAVMVIDIDRFGQVNDTLGHDLGDRLLVEVVQRLRSRVRKSDTLSRFGGEEFTIFVRDAEARAAVDRVAEEVQKAFQDPFVIDRHRVELTASIGIAIAPEDGRDSNVLLQHAAQALYLSKDVGRSRVRFFSSKLQEAAEDRRMLAQDLREAIAAGQLEVHYQPIVDLSTGAIHKAEALVRWRHPSRGLVSPAVFIPIAEATNLIHQIGDWVFRQACQDTKRWRERFGDHLQISVNRSPAQFRVADDGRPTWAEHMKSLGLPGQSIALEITEGLLLDEVHGVADKLQSMRSAGIAISLDDFGTGYSAMAYLHKYPFDYLKIDRSFVSALEPASKNMLLCKAMIVMAHELGMKVVAEGVETPQQRDLLADSGCDYAQGYHFSRPLPAQDFEALLARSQAQ